VFFFYLALDDGAQVHERVAVAISDFFALTAEREGVFTGPVGWLGRLIHGFPSYAWQVLLGPVFVAFGVFLIVFFRRALDRRLARLALSGLVLYAAAQGQDFLEGLGTPYERVTAALGTEPYTVPPLREGRGGVGRDGRDDARALGAASAPRAKGIGAESPHHRRSRGRMRCDSRLEHLAMRSKSRSWWSTASPLRIAQAAIRQSTLDRTVRPARLAAR